mgnify:CR=1 FL=1
MAQLRSKIVRHRPDIVVLSPWKDFHDGFASQGDGGEGEGADQPGGLFAG